MIYRISENIDEHYKKMSRRAKAWAAIAIVAIILLMLVSAAFALYYRYQRDKVIADYEKLLEKSHQNYYIQGIANSNLEKKLQDLMLELATLRNNTVEMERMFAELREDNANLEEIRRRLQQGIVRTKSQLDHMESSVTSIINQRQKAIIYTEEEILSKKDSLGVHARYPER